MKKGGFRPNSKKNMELFRSQNINQVKFPESAESDESRSPGPDSHDKYNKNDENDDNDNILKIVKNNEEINIVDCHGTIMDASNARPERLREKEKRGKHSKIPGRLESRKVFKKFKNIKREAVFANQGVRNGHSRNTNHKNVHNLKGIGGPSLKAVRVRDSRRGGRPNGKHLEPNFNGKNHLNKKRYNCSAVNYRNGAK